MRIPKLTDLIHSPGFDLDRNRGAERRRVGRRSRVPEGSPSIRLSEGLQLSAIQSLIVPASPTSTRKRPIGIAEVHGSMWHSRPGEPSFRPGISRIRRLQPDRLHECLVAGDVPDLEADPCPSRQIDEGFQLRLSERTGVGQVDPLARNLHRTRGRTRRPQGPDPARDHRSPAGAEDLPRCGDTTRRPRPPGSPPHESLALSDLLNSRQGCS